MDRLADLVALILAAALHHFIRQIIGRRTHSRGQKPGDGVVAPEPKVDGYFPQAMRRDSR